MSLPDALKRLLPAVDGLLRDILVPTDDSFKSFYGMAQYHHGWLDQELRPIEADSGKRIRPALCLLCCEAMGGSVEDALPVSVAIELLHNFSLVHDDIQDSSPTRRHRPTVWALWGEPHAINVGDMLMAQANRALLLDEERVGAAVTAALVRRFQETCIRLCEGQYLDMAFEDRDAVSVADYYVMIERKTAALLAYAGWAGATAARVPSARADELASFGTHLGLAFQIQDDLLGIWGDEEATGKSVATDINAAKKTLPLLLALAELPAAEAQRLSALYSQEARSGADVAEARRLIEASGAQAGCEARVAQELDAARAALAEAQPTPEGGALLQELLDSLVGRKG